MSEIQDMAKRMHEAILPLIEGEGADVVIPALLTLAVGLTMETQGDGPSEAFARVIATLNDAHNNRLS